MNQGGKEASVTASCDCDLANLLNSIQRGEALEVLRTLPSDSIDLIVTSPPYYRQRNYNGKGVGQEERPDLYLEVLLETFGECRRVVKPNGNIVYNLGDKYLKGSLALLPYRFAISACDRFAVKLINEITWIKRNPTPRQFTRRLVSSTEPFFHFAKTNQYFYDRKNFMHEETNNIESNPSNRLGQSYKRLIHESSTLTQDQKQLARRELEDVILEVKEKKVQGFRMKIKGVHAEAFGGQEGGRKDQMNKKGYTIIKLTGQKMKRDVIESIVETLPGTKHTAVFPLKIIRELVRLLSPPKGIVLDPYMGSGTTAVAALMEGCDYIGIEIDGDYCEDARRRIGSVEKASHG